MQSVSARSAGKAQAV